MLQPIISRKASCPFVADISNESENSNHFHSDLELIFLLSGRITYLIGGIQYNLKARDFIFANPYELHSVSFVSDDCRYVHLLIQENRLRPLFSTSDTLMFTWQESLNNRKHALYSEVASAIRSIVLEGTNQENGYIANAFQEVMRILIALNRWCRQPALPERSGKKPLNQQQKAREIMDFLNSHFMEQISLETISKSLYLSPPYISKIFKENFQVGVLEYLNRLRIQKSVFALCHTNAYIADIAEDCGFTNAKTFSRIFLKEMGLSPTDYRRQYANEDPTLLAMGTTAPADYVQLLDFSAEGEFFSSDHEAAAYPIRFDFTGVYSSRTSCSWNKILYIGGMDQLLMHRFRLMIQRAIDDFDYEFIRFTGVFSDAMHSYQEDEYGNPRYFWMQLDEVLYFITQHKVKPYIGLGYMPKQLASMDTPSPYAWQANTSFPKSLQKWENYLKAFLKHQVQLYSYDEVCSWRFDFWNDPYLPGVFWHDTPQAFREFFLVSYKAFRSVLPDGQFGSPGFAFFDHFKQAEEFLNFCIREKVQFDFLTFHIFELTDPRNPDFKHMNDLWAALPSQVHGSAFVVNAAKEFQAVAERAGYRVPIAITEWNVSPYFNDLSRDTAFMGPYIVDTVNKLPPEIESITFWALSDQDEEHKPNQDMFAGELGFRTNNDLPKPSYLTFKLLHRCQGKVLKSGENYFITRSKHGYHIGLYNYSFFNEEFLNGTNRPLSRKNRYQIFETTRDKRFNLDLTLEPGHYRIERHILDREHGSIYDGWVRMGAPEFIDRICFSYLEKLAFPDMSIQYRNIHNSLIFSEQVPQHGIVLLSLIRLGDET